MESWIINRVGQKGSAGGRRITHRAREVLDDCHLALELLEAETDLAKWRIHWVAALALVRAVGHVLQKVDGAERPRVRIAAQSAFERWKSDDAEHEIFREFIERERNNILKQYAFAVHPSEEVPVLLEVDLEAVDGSHSAAIIDVQTLGENVYRPILGGYREGDDARDVLTEAIEWWDVELNRIEEAAGHNDPE